MEKIMDNEGSKKIFSYDKDISFYEFKERISYEIYYFIFIFYIIWIFK